MKRYLLILAIVLATSTAFALQTEIPRDAATVTNSDVLDTINGNATDAESRLVALEALPVGKGRAWSSDDEPYDKGDTVTDPLTFKMYISKVNANIADDLTDTNYWNPVVGAGASDFADLGGSPEDNPALSTALGLKANAADVYTKAQADAADDVGATSVAELLGIDTTGWAVGKVVEFASDGELVVGDKSDGTTDLGNYSNATTVTITSSSGELTAIQAATESAAGVLSAADKAAINLLDSASTRAAEDTMTDGSNLPDGAAIIAYAAANGWGAGGITYVSQSDCSTITDGICLDSDDGAFYLYNGTSVVLIGTDLDDALAGDGITLTDNGNGTITIAADIDTAITNGNTTKLISSDLAFDEFATKEDSLGNPDTDGKVLSSTATGVRSWVAQGSGSFAFDTYPTYEDSAHNSGIAVNATTLAVYSAAASKWLTVGLTDTLDPTPPTLTSATIPTSGDTVSLLFSESVTVGAGGNGGWTLNTPTDAMTYSSGSGSTTLVYSLASTINSTDSPTITYTQPGNGIEATTGGVDVASISAGSVTNNSTQTSGADCSGDLMLAASFENNDDLTQGTPAGCSDGDTTWTLTSATYSSTQAGDGTYSLSRSGTYQYASLGVSASDTFNPDEFKVEFLAYVDTFGLLSLFESKTDTQNYIAIKVAGSSTDIRMGLTYEVGDTIYAVTIPTSSGRVEDEWFFVRAIAKVGTTGNDMKIEVCDSDGTSNCVSTEADKDHTSMSTKPTSLTVYNNSAVSGAAYVDALKVYGTSGY